MLSIILNDNELDIFEDTEIVWQWTAFRFQTAIRDAFSNNFSIPKTNHNIQVLGVYSLLDQTDIQFEGRLQPAVMNLNGTIMPIYIQVVSINEKEIEICIYEDKLMYWIKGKSFENKRDTSLTIFQWNQYSREVYPDDFKWYNYGEPYDTRYAQLHPSIKLNDILDNIGAENGISFSHVSDLWRIICTKKVVCPENKIQVLEFNGGPGKLEDDRFTIFGGQHITNDVSFAGSDVITFNRHTEVNMKIWYSFYRKGTLHSKTSIFLYKNGQHLTHFDLPSDSYQCHYGYVTYNFTFEEGDTLWFLFPNSNKYKSVSCVVRMLHSNYDISDEDYGSDELLYKDRRPRLSTYNPDAGALETEYTYFDGGYYHGIGTELLSFSYFGKWCNFPSLPIGDFLYSLQYILYMRCVAREDNTIFFEPFVEKTAEVDCELSKLQFHSSSCAKKNFVKWKNGDDQSPIVEFDNEWLQDSKVWSSNIFAWIKNDRVVKQYTYKITEPTNTEDKPVVSYEFEEIDAPVLLFFLPPHNQPATLHYFGLDRINNCKEMQFSPIVTPPDITELDTIYVEGREYYIIEGEKNFKTGKTEIKALLIV